MKRFSLILSAILILTSTALFTGCSKKNSSSANSPAQILCQQFNSIVSKNNNISLEKLAEELTSNKIINFYPVVMKVSEGYLNGFTSEIKGFSDGCMFSPMIGSIPFIGYVFRTDSPEALIAELKSKADLRWNICTQADELVTDSVKNVVFFIMAPASFEEE